MSNEYIASWDSSDFNFKAILNFYLSGPHAINGKFWFQREGKKHYPHFQYSNKLRAGLQPNWWQNMIEIDSFRNEIWREWWKCTPFFAFLGPWKKTDDTMLWHTKNFNSWRKTAISFSSTVCHNGIQKVNTTTNLQQISSSYFKINQIGHLEKACMQ